MSISPADVIVDTNRNPALAGLASELVEARSLPDSPTSAAAVRASSPTLAQLWLPAVVLHAEELRHNLDLFAQWCDQAGLDLAPHGKTTMAPQLWWSQLERGAWGITAATAAQARIMQRYGVPRVLIANEVVDPAQLAWLATTLGDDDFTAMCLVDSAEGLDRMDRALSRAPRPLPVLVELGVPGRRTGVRDVGEALELARRIAHTPHLQLAGVAGYEGVFPQRRDTDAPLQARAWLDRLGAFLQRADAAGLFAETGETGETGEVIITAGGSAYPDLVADAFATLPQLSVPIRRILRSGCYVTHDDLFLERSSPLRAAAASDPLRPALSCYARVLSHPEPGRALIGAGKREVSFDIDLPVPRAIHRDGQRIPVHNRFRVVELNDHHGFLDIAAPEEGGEAVPQVGDVIELGLSHPCTVFDKWSLIPVLNAEHRVVDAVRTRF